MNYLDPTNPINRTDFIHNQLSPKQRYRRVVIKVGTSLVCDASASDGIHHGRLNMLRDEIVFLRQKGVEVMLVSSGAVYTGSQRLKSYGLNTQKNSHLARRQALSALGQHSLMGAYQQVMHSANIPVAQLLLTAGDFRNRRSYLNIQHTINELLQLDALAIVNENDTIAVDELQFGENDLLSAACAASFHADFLIILSSVEGFMMNGKRISCIEKLLPEHWQVALGPQGPGQGGMRTKLRAAHLCRLSGISCAILSGKHPQPIQAFFSQNEDIGTYFPATARYRMSARKRWILFSCVRGLVIVDIGAREAIEKRGSSLLPVGIHSLRGQFLANEVVEVKDQTGTLIGRGIINYSYREVLPMLGLSSEQLVTKGLIWRQRELIHRSNFVLEQC